MSELSDLTRDMSNAPAQIHQDAIAAMRKAQERLRALAQSIEHVKTGHMRDTTTATGPFSVGPGMLQSTIQSEAWYTIHEIERGGAHDWMTRTIDEGAAVIDALAAEVAGAAVTAIVRRS